MISLRRRAPVHVSIHDVSPASATELEEALAMCEDAGAMAALLVVPSFHGKWPLDRYPAFVDRLRTLQERGHEVHLHGFYHRADGDLKGARAFFAQRVASAGEAEFTEVLHKKPTQSSASTKGAHDVRVWLRHFGRPGSWRPHGRWPAGSSHRSRRAAFVTPRTTCASTTP